MGKISFCAKERNFYCLKADINGQIIRKTFYVNRYQNVYDIIYRGYVTNPSPLQRTITFLLTDRSYDNLPISKGEMILWQR